MYILDSLWKIDRRLTIMFTFKQNQSHSTLVITCNIGWMSRCLMMMIVMIKRRISRLSMMISIWWLIVVSIIIILTKISMRIRWWTRWRWLNERLFQIEIKISSVFVFYWSTGIRRWTRTMMIVMIGLISLLRIIIINK